MSHDADRLALLETQVRELRQQLIQQETAPPRIAPSRTRRTALVLVLALALLVIPAIALAAHQFSDVPTSNPFHADIGALVNAGVTAGCGNNRYCPGANVTREQMAAFMNRLGALGPGKTPVVNADKLDGLDSKAFITHWVTVENGAVRSHSPGLQGVQVIIPDGTTGTYCIRLPASANVEAEAAVGSPQDTYAGFQAYGIAVTTTRGHNCNVVGSWHIAVDTTADGAAINTDFNVIIPGGGIVSVED